MSKENIILVSLLGLLIVVSGCTQSNADVRSNANGQDAFNSTESSVSDEESADREEVDYSEFEIRDVQYPTDAEVGKTFSIRIETRNIGNESGVFSRPLRIRGSDNMSYRRSLWVNDSTEVAPGDFHEFNESLKINDVGGYSFYFLGSEGGDGGISVEPRKAKIGESVENFAGVEISVENFRFKEKPEREGFRYALLDITAKNNAEKEKDLPKRTEFDMDLGIGAELENTTRFGELYQSENVQSGGSSSGILVYEVVDDYEKSELEYTWKIVEKTENGVEIGKDAIKWTIKNK